MVALPKDTLVKDDDLKSFTHFKEKVLLRGLFRSASKRLMRKRGQK